MRDPDEAPWQAVFKRCADETEMPRSTVLSAAKETMVVEFRRRTLLPLDDVLGCLRDTIPSPPNPACTEASSATASPRLPESLDRASKRAKLADAAIGYVHIDIGELSLGQSKLNVLLAIDRAPASPTSSFETMPVR